MASVARDIVLSYEPRSPRQPHYVRYNPIGYGDIEESLPVIFLDLDNTLISAVERDSLSVAECNNLIHRYGGKYRNIGPYIVFPRRYLDYFLTNLFKSYRVAVWTAASKDYARRVVDYFIIEPDTRRKLEMFLWRDQTEYIEKLGWGKKALHALSTEYVVHSSLEDAYIVDDHIDVWRTQPERTLRVKEFEAQDEDQGGDSLLKVLNILDRTVRYGIPFKPIGEDGL